MLCFKKNFLITLRSTLFNKSVQTTPYRRKAFVYRLVFFIGHSPLLFIYERHMLGIWILKLGRKLLVKSIKELDCSELLISFAALISDFIWLCRQYRTVQALFIKFLCINKWLFWQKYREKWMSWSMCGICYSIRSVAYLKKAMDRH